MELKILIVGLGGVGGYFGGLLARQYFPGDQHQVIFLSRGAHGDAVKEKGLEVISRESGTFNARPQQVCSDPSEAGPTDLVIFAVKGYDLEDAALSIKSVVNEETVVITLLNGVNNAEILSGILPHARILNGCVYISSRIESPGIVRHVGGPGKIFFGPEKGDTGLYGSIEKVLTDASIKAELTDRIGLEVWRKFMFMSPFAGVTALKGQTFGEVLGSEESFKLLKGMMMELEQLGRKTGVDLPGDIVSLSLETGRKFPSETKSSMQLDFEKNKKNELDTFIGYVVRQCREEGIQAPLYNRVYSELSRLAD